jgi:hypothetical protein
VDLANMRQNGVRSLEIICHQCRHKTVMNVDHLPGDTKCGTIGADVRPNWPERERR